MLNEEMAFTHVRARASGYRIAAAACSRTISRRRESSPGGADGRRWRWRPHRGKNEGGRRRGHASDGWLKIERTTTTRRRRRRYRVIPFCGAENKPGKNLSSPRRADHSPFTAPLHYYLCRIFPPSQMVGGVGNRPPRPPRRGRVLVGGSQRTRGGGRGITKKLLRGWTSGKR